MRRPFKSLALSKDSPMSTDTRDERLARRTSDLYATDPQFAAAKPDPAVVRSDRTAGVATGRDRAHGDGGLRRPARRSASAPLTSSATPRAEPRRRLLPHFDTITYRELWDRVNALTSAVADVHPGDRVAILGFASVDYTVIDMATIPLGAISRTTANERADHVTATDRHRNRTRPHRLEHRLRRGRRRTRADRQYARLPDRLRLPPRDHRPPRGLRRRRAELAEAAARWWWRRCRTCSSAERRCPRGPLPLATPTSLALLIYTSGSTGAPKGAIYTRTLRR